MTSSGRKIIAWCCLLSLALLFCVSLHRQSTEEWAEEQRLLCERPDPFAAEVLARWGAGAGPAVAVAVAGKSP